MEEPKDPGEYGREYGEEKFWDKARASFQQAGERVLELALQLFFAARDEKTPGWARTVIYGALGYFIVPTDAVPDFLPVTGFMDDLGVLTAALAAVAFSVTEEHRTRARKFVRKLKERAGA